MKGDAVEGRESMAPGDAHEKPRRVWPGKRWGGRAVFGLLSILGLCQIGSPQDEDAY